MATERTDCETCGTRIILARGMPPLNWAPDPAGPAAAEHLVTGGWRARFPDRGEIVVVPEKRHAIHHCADAADPHEQER